jgi:hypothetical protein
LAAFLDGTLTSDERAQVLDVLARSPAAFDVLAEAAAIQADLAERAAPARKLAPQDVRRPRRYFRLRVAIQRRAALWLWAPVAAAATIATLLLLPIALERGNGQMALGLLDGATLVGPGGAGSLQSAFGPQWSDVGWSVMRGSGAAAAEPGQAFRIGARIADYEASAGARDTEALSQVSGQLQELLSNRVGGSAHALTYERLTERALLGADPASFPRERAAAASAVHELLEQSPWLELGIWTEQARLAALAGRSDFFADGGDAMTVLNALTERFARADSADPVLVDRLHQLNAMLADGPGESQLDSVRSLLDEVIRRAAN